MGSRAQDGRGISIASVPPDTPGPTRFGTVPFRAACGTGLVGAANEIDMKIRQWLLSITVFVVLLGVLASVDERVQDSLTQLVSGGNPVHRRAMGVVDALFSAAQYQSIENGPMMAFVALGFVLFVFMVRS
jgi:hypothetical protein